MAARPRVDEGFRFYRIMRRLFLVLARAVFRFRVDGARRIPAVGGAVLVAAHHSWLDPPCVGGACRRPVRFLILDSVFDRTGATWFYRRMGCIPVSPGRRASANALRSALRHLRDGGLVGVFPHGRVVPRHAGGPVHPGAALLAMRSGAPLIPISIEGSERAWPPGRRWPGPAAVRVRVGQAIAPPQGRGRASRAELLRRIEQAISG